MTKRKEQVMEYISIDLIDEPKNPARFESIENGLQELSDSIKVRGVIEPLILQPRGGRYEIVAGHRRFLAAKMAAVVQVPSIVRSRDDKENREDLIHENIHRADMSVFEEAVFFETLHKDHGMSQADIARAVGKTGAFVSQHMQVLKWPDDLKGHLRSGAIAFTVGRKLMEIKDENARTYYIDQVALGGANYRTVEEWVRIANSPPAVPPAGEDGTSPPRPLDGPSVYRPICWLCGTAAEMSDLTTVQLDRDCAHLMRDAFLAAQSETPPKR